MPNRCDDQPDLAADEPHGIGIHLGVDVALDPRHPGADAEALSRDGCRQ